jgi:hypothetical protein
VRDPERCQEGHGWKDVQHMTLSVRVDSSIYLAKQLRSKWVAAKFDLMRPTCKHVVDEVGPPALRAEIWTP